MVPFFVRSRSRSTPFHFSGPRRQPTRIAERREELRRAAEAEENDQNDQNDRDDQNDQENSVDYRSAIQSMIQDKRARTEDEDEND